MNTLEFNKRLFPLGYKMVGGGGYAVFSLDDEPVFNGVFEAPMAAYKATLHHIEKANAAIQAVEQTVGAAHRTPSQVPEVRWLPIGDAPKDGRELVVCDFIAPPEFARWVAGPAHYVEGGYWRGRDAMCRANPSHFIDLCQFSK